MKPDFALRFTGGAFVASALMLWLGWVLLPVRLDTFFEPEVFAQIHAQFRFWIWMYRLHLFGMIVTVIAVTALAALVADSPARILIWPGAAVLSSGMLVNALGAAFYYHHGAWGALDLARQPPEAALALVEALRLDTEFTTCLVRFGRVFGGLGLALLAWGMLRFRLLPSWLGAVAGVIGIAAMALTMGLPDDLHLFLPIFHAFALWLVAAGVVILRRGVELSAAEAKG